MGSDPEFISEYEEAPRTTDDAEKHAYRRVSEARLELISATDQIKSRRVRGMAWDCVKKVDRLRWALKERIG